MKGPEVARSTRFDVIRYAQVWEDPRVLLAQEVPTGDALSIASAGDNALSLLATGVHHVYAVDLNPTQLHCLALRVGGIRTLTREQLMAFLGLTDMDPSERWAMWKQKVSVAVSEEAREFWNTNRAMIKAGAGTVGKFERYLAKFRHTILPLVHGRKRISQLLRQEQSREERLNFYHHHWNSWRWRCMLRFFFSRQVMGALGRSPAFFRYVEGSVSAHVAGRVAHALVEQDPGPYLEWILTGRYERTCPTWLEPEVYAKLSCRLENLSWHLASLGEVEEFIPEKSLSLLNLSDVFEYMSEAETEALMRRLLPLCKPGARWVYWNMMAPRSRPQTLADRLKPLSEMSEEWHQRDRAFFYRRLVIEEVQE